MRNRFLPIYKNIIITLLMLLLTMASGCGPVMGIIADTMPQPDVPAEYDSANKNVVVYVHPAGNTELNPVFARELTNRLNSELLKHKAANSVIEYSLLSDLKLNAHDAVTIESIGKKFKPDLIINIEINLFSIDYTDTDSMNLGQVLCLVSVVDPKTGHRLWPSNKLSELYSIQSKLDHDSNVRLSSSLVQRDLAQQTAVSLSKLFYEHKKEKEY